MTIPIQVSKHGKRLGISKDDQVIARGGIVAGGGDKPSIVFPAPDTTAVFDDFQHALIQAVDTGVPLGAGLFRQVTGDTGHGSLNVAGTNGVFRLFNTPSATATAVGASGKGISGALQWKVNQGPGAHSGRLRFATRVKFVPDDGGSALSATLNRLHVFAGFTDIATYEFPALDTGAGTISAADDFVGFMYSPDATAGLGWYGVAGNATVDTRVTLSVTPTVNVWHTLEVEIHRGSGDTNGTATFYVDGVPKGSLSSPVLSTVALAPCVYAFQQDTGKQGLDIDWVNASAARDTGL